MTFCLFFFVLSDLAFRWPGGIRFRNDTGRILFDCCFFGNLEPTLIILRVMNLKVFAHSIVFFFIGPRLLL